MMDRSVAADAIAAQPSLPPSANPARDPAAAGRSRLTFRRTLGLIRSDYARMASHYRFPLTMRRAIGLTILPVIVTLVLYRLSHYFYVRGWRFLAWPLYTFNAFLTGADIVPSTEIGESCLLGHSVGTILSGKIGNNATILAKVGVGGGRGPGKDGNLNGLPTIGDFVTLGVNCTVMGPIEVGDYATVGAHSLVIHDVPNDGIVMGVPARLVRFRKPGEGWYGTIAEMHDAAARATAT